MNLTRLKPPDTKAVLDKGCYVYCYLRHSDSATAVAGTPYYIGIASTAERPFRSHRQTPVPANKALVRILRSGLDWADACQWERFYIKRYGRKDIGTGILLNKTDGGDGTLGWVPSAKTRAKMSQNKPALSLETRAKIGAVHRGKTISAEHRAKVAAAARGRVKSSEELAKISAARKGHTHSAETRAKIAKKNSELSPEIRAKIGETRKAGVAAKYGIPSNLYLLLCDKDRYALIRYIKRTPEASVYEYAERRGWSHLLQPLAT